MNKTSPKYSVRQRVTGKVDRVLPYGVFVRLADGTRGYIRRREMSWAGDIDPREIVRLGQEIQAVVLDLGGRERNIELSHKDILPDPWEGFVDQFQEGDVVQGIVKNLMPFGAFVEIVPGVDGLVLLEELAPWPLEKPEEVVWIGDAVQAVIVRIDREAKKVQLSIKARLRQRARTVAIMGELYGPIEEGEAIESYSGAVSPAVDNESSLPDRIDLSAIEQLGRILVVEDEDQLRLSLVEWLRNQGCIADSARNAEEAEERIRKQTYGLLLVDIYLPGRNGLDLIERIREWDGAETQIVVMSTPEWIEKHAARIAKLNVLEVFAKPLVLEEVRHLLFRIGAGESISPWQKTSQEREVTKSESAQTLVDVTCAGASLGERLQIILEQLIEDTGAEAGAIFRLDPLLGDISIEVTSGVIGETAEEDAIYSLDKSPVRDVIVDKESVFERVMSSGVERRFRKLLDLLPFESCIGVPVAGEGETQRALFLFHGESRAFSHYRLRDARAAAVLVAAVVERAKMAQEAQSLGRLLLSGELAAGLGHEIYNKMSGLEIQLRNLRADWRRLERQAPGLNEYSESEEVQQGVDALLETSKDLGRTVEVFQRLMRAREDQELNVNRVVRHAEMLLRYAMHDKGTTVTSELDPNLPPARGNEARLQQVFLNLMLNAVQQMRLISRDGMLHVKTAFQPQDGARPIKVRFSDNGPGIHRRLWEKVFSLGFSTRPGGTGQGLFIARSLAESMGGRISVEESFVPLGTTFLVEIPTVTQSPESSHDKI